MKIVVIGSSNTDLVIRSKTIPAPGETVLGEDLITNPGGKGANQAVAAARSGGEVTLVAKLGKDSYGDQSLEGFKDEGIITEYIFHDEVKPSGVALIMVDENGENCISVALGANNSLNSEDIDLAEKAIQDAQFLLIQLEIPLDTVIYAIKKASSLGTPVVLNPAPAMNLPEYIYKDLYAITPNQSEAEILTGITVKDIMGARKASLEFRKLGVKNVILTMGHQGAFISNGNEESLIPANKVSAIDTTAAGDTFNGALAVALSEGKSLKIAVEFANLAAALSVTKMGAQKSIPMREEIEIITNQNR